MKFFFLTTAFLLGLTLVAKTQNSNLRFGIHIGYDSYQLGDLESLEQDLASNMIPRESLYPVKVLPNYMDIGVDLSAVFNEFVFGVQYTFRSTGSRYHLGDYSGEASINSVLNGNFLSLYGKLNIISALDRSFRTYMGVAPQYFWGTYDLDQFLNIQNRRAEMTTNFTTNGMGAEYFLNVEQELGIINLSVKLGYFLTISSGLYYDGERVYSSSDDTNGFSVDWGGLRTSFGIMFNLNKVSSE